MYHKIEKFCKEQKISISQMCTNLGIAPQVITNLKNRTKTNANARLDVESTAKIADFMGISVLELIKNEEEGD